ncbi:hypothetical protein K1T71_010012 [Dendrolimus kikuchii]|uniref:Uncharacterized protein n=1 Tax=Dendrolimus kikuchii TaxID=765133 RepID=A0ACC1CTD3_9NEOP|nr:hypothetical protein K1T71_010012 [Dendrolimus kikuchii]
MSAYLMWLNSSRQDIKKDNPGLKMTDIAKKAGEMWRSMKDKSEWEQKAADAKDAYTKEMESFNANGGDAGGGGEPKGKKKTQKRGKKAPAPKAKPKRAKDDDDDDDDEEDDDEDDD